MIFFHRLVDVLTIDEIFKYTRLSVTFTKTQYYHSQSATSFIVISLLTTQITYLDICCNSLSERCVIHYTFKRVQLRTENTNLTLSRPLYILFAYWRQYCESLIELAGEMGDFSLTGHFHPSPWWSFPGGDLFTPNPPNSSPHCFCTNFNTVDNYDDGTVL